MGRIITQNVNNFSQGIASDLRVTDFRFAGMIKHFDTTYPHRLVQYPKTEAVETKSLDVVKFQYAPTSGNNFLLYGYGQASGGTQAKIVTYDIDGENRGTTTWQTPGSAEGTTNTRNEKVFFYYKNYLYNWAGGSRLQRYGDLTSSPTFTDEYQSISYTDVAQPVHHKEDDIAYFFSDNKVHTLDNTTFTANVLTLPDNLVIAGATEYGNFLAIACRPKVPLNSTYHPSESSVLYLWNRDTSQTVFTDRIVLGTGRVIAVAELDGQLIVLMDYFTNYSLGLRDSKVVIKKIIAGEAFTIREIPVDDASSTLYEYSSNDQANTIVIHDRLYFPAKIIYKADTNTGIWCVDANGRLTIEHVEEDVSGVNEFQGIYKIGGTWIVAHSNDGSVNFSDDNRVYDYTSVYETPIISGGDAGTTKKLIGVTVYHEPLPTGGQVVIKFRKDADIRDTAWASATTIITNTTDNDTRTSAVNSSGTTFPNFKEIQFRIEATDTGSTGVEITGIRWKLEEIADDKYAF